MGFAEGTPTVAAQLGGRDYALGFTLGAMRRIKERLGSLVAENDDGEDAMIRLPVYVWACMDAEDRAGLTPEAIEDQIHPGNMKALSDAIAALFQASQPEGAEGNARKPAKARPASQT